MLKDIAKPRLLHPRTPTNPTIEMARRSASAIGIRPTIRKARHTTPCRTKPQYFSRTRHQTTTQQAWLSLANSSSHTRKTHSTRDCADFGPRSLPDPYPAAYLEATTSGEKVTSVPLPTPLRQVSSRCGAQLLLPCFSSCLFLGLEGGSVAGKIREGRDLPKFGRPTKKAVTFLGIVPSSHVNYPSFSPVTWRGGREPHAVVLSAGTGRRVWGSQRQKATRNHVLRKV